MNHVVQLCSSILLLHMLLIIPTDNGKPCTRVASCVNVSKPKAKTIFSNHLYSTHKQEALFLCRVGEIS